MIKFNILDKIREAQKLAIKENMKVNAIQLSKDFVKIPELTTHSTDYGCVSVTYPMICGLRCYIDNDNELPEEYVFALFDDGQSHLDVETVKYGEWVDLPDYGGGGWAMKGSGEYVQPRHCSICGDVYTKKYKYCPSCGVKMENSDK